MDGAPGNNSVKSLSDRELLERIYALLRDGAAAFELLQSGNKLGAMRTARRAAREWKA